MLPTDRVRGPRPLQFIVRRRPEVSRVPRHPPHRLTVSLAEVGRDDLQLVGGKGANLGEIIRSGLPVPGGFCVTTDAYSLVAEEAGLQRIVTELHSTEPEDAERLE